jgi:hypothetical protein
VKHVTTITKTPLLANNETTDLSFLLSILGLGFDLVTTFIGAFSIIFEGLLSALGQFNAVKNPES